MPWTVQDVERHRKGLSDTQKRRWVAVANSVLRRCLADGKSTATCEGAAIRQANGVVANTAEALHMYTLTVNAADIRYETFDDKAWLVVPVVPIREAVLNGYMVSADEIGAFVDAWNGIPLICSHPKNTYGEYISAQSPPVLEQSIGRLFGAHMQGDALVGELWIDIEKCDVQGGEALECLTRLENEKALEVSTGFWSATIESPGIFRGQSYLGQRVHIRPNHLALLPNDVGACSNAMGCGAFCTNAACACQKGDAAMATEDAEEKHPGKLRQALRTLFAFANDPEPEPEPEEEPPPAEEPGPSEAPEPDETDEDHQLPLPQAVSLEQPIPLKGARMLTKTELVHRVITHAHTAWTEEQTPVLQGLEERMLEQMLAEADRRQQDAPLTLKALQTELGTREQALRAEYDQKLATHVQRLEEKQEREQLLAYFAQRGWKPEETDALPITALRRMHQELDPVSYLGNGMPRLSAQAVDANLPDDDPKYD